MELQEFIKEALIQISNGILDAGNSCQERGITINPLTKGGEGITITLQNNFASIVKFKVVLCHSNDTSNKNGIGLFLSGIGVGVSSEDKR